MSNLDIKFKRLTPFKRCVLQNFPFIEADFDALTNYGLLCKIVEYLNQVIASQNEVQGVTEEIVTAFNNLYDYVHDYFENLDVQEEINNKLDSMVEDGTLQEIIASYLQANVCWTFDTVADMKAATNLIAGSYAKTLGFYSVDDGGGATYTISDTGTADEYKVIAVGDLYATIVNDNVVNVKQYGAKGDGTTDDSDAIQACLDNSKNIIFTKANYYITKSLNISSNIRIDGQGAKIFTDIESNTINTFTGSNLTNVEICNFEFDGSYRSISIENSTYIRLHDLTIKTIGWGILLKLTNYFNVENITFNQTRTSDYSNTDGVHVNGGKHGIIRNIYGTTDDDMIALNADETSGLIGDIIDVVVDHVVTVNSQEYGSLNATYRGIKIYSRGSRIDDILIKNCVIASDHDECVLIFRHTANTSNIGNIIIENCTFYKNHSRYASVITASTPFESLTVRNCTLKYLGGNGAFYTQENDNSYGRVIFDNVKFVDESNTERGFLMFGGTTDNVTVNNIKFAQNTPYTLISLRGTCENVNINEVDLKGQRYLVSVISSATVNKINISNVSGTAIVSEEPQTNSIVNISGLVAYLNIVNAIVLATYAIYITKTQTLLTITGNNINFAGTKMLNAAGHTTKIRLNGQVLTDFYPDTDIANVGDTFIYKLNSDATMRIFTGGSWVSL